MIDKNKFKKRMEILVGDGNVTAFAKRIGCDPKTIAAAVGGKIPGINILDKILEGKHSISWLLGELDEPAVDEIKGSVSQPDQFDQVLDGFFEKVKTWIAEEDGRKMNSALEFIEEFNDNFDNYVEWRKKQTGRSVVPGPPSKVSNSGK